MLNKTKYGLILAILFFSFAGSALAAPYFRQEAGLVPITDSTYYLGTTTPSVKAWLSIITDQICLTGDTCRTTWPTGGSGSGNVATSSQETSTYIPFWTSTNATPATLSGGNSLFTWNNTVGRLIFPYATTTYLTATTASTSALRASNSFVAEFLGTGLAKFTSGALGLATAGVDYVAGVTGDWTGTLDGFEGSTLFSGKVSTSSVPTIGNLSYWTGNGTPSTLGGVATSLPTVTAPITFSGTLGSFVGGIAGTFDCISATGSVKGCLTATDWTTFNNKQPAGSYLTSYDGWTHATVGLSATTSALAVSTSTNPTLYPVTSYSATLPQLSLSAGAGIAQWAFRNAGGNLYLATTTTAGTATTSTAAITVNGAAGNGLGIGTTTPFATLAVNPLAGFNSNQFVVGSSTATSLRLDNSGHLFLPQLTTDGSAHTYTLCGAATTFEAIWDTTTCVLSAAKFKMNIEDLDIGLNELLKIRPVQFNWKPTGDEKYDNDINTKHNQIGIIANEIEKVDKRLVTYDNNGEIKGFRYDFFTAWVVAGIKDFYGEFQVLVARVSGLETRLNKLEQKNLELENRLKILENEKVTGN